MLKIIYEVPLFIFVILSIYTIWQLIVARKLLAGGEIRRPYLWFIIASIFFALWGVDHIFHDFFPLSAESAHFFHYVISHGLLLISMIFITIAARLTSFIYKATISADEK